MNEDSVIIFRDESDADLIGMIAGDTKDEITVLHPYFIHHNPIHNTIMMMPYCVFTNNALYEFTKSKIKFVVPATADLSSRFVKMLSQPGEQLSRESTVEGNETRH